MQRMNQLDNDFDQAQRQRRIDDAMKSLNRHFFDPSAPKRLISGVALSSGDRNSKGIAFKAQGMTCRLPLPLLIDHDLDRPVGRVTNLWQWGRDTLLFRAEIGNDMSIAHSIWADIQIRSVTCVSVHAAGELSTDMTFERWHLDELSLTRKGGDPGAIIKRCSELLPHVSLKGPSETVWWNDARD